MVEKREENKVMLFAVLIMAILAVEKLAGLSINEFVYVGVFAILFLNAKFSSVVEMICFFMPLAFLVSSIAYIWLVTLVVLIAKSNFKIKANRVAIIFFFTCLELLAHFLYGISNVNRMGGYILSMALIFYLLYDSHANLNYERCVKLYSYGAFGLCLLFLLNAIVNAPNNWMQLMASGMLRFGSTVNSKFGAMTVNLNANTLAYYSLTGLTTSLVVSNSVNQMSQIEKCFYWFQLLFVTVVGMLTVSRSWLLSVVVCMMLYIISKMNTPKRFFKYTLIVIVAVLVGFILFAQDGIPIVEAFVSRFTNSEMATGSGRTDIFAEYMNVFMSSERFQLFGTGVTDYIEVTGMWQSMHMGLEQIVICLGMPGAGIFLIVLMKPIIKMFRFKVNLLYWIPIISVVLFTQTIQFLNPNLLMLPFAIGCYSLKAGIPNKKAV